MNHKRVYRLYREDGLSRRLRALTVVHAFTREALAIDVDQCIKGERVVAAMADRAVA